MFIKSKLHYTKILLQITKLHHQIIKQIYIPESKLPVQIPEVINRYILFDKAVMTLPDPDLRRGLQGTLLYSLKAR